jgi:adenine phosphoribosyltransferase
LWSVKFVEPYRGQEFFELRVAGLTRRLPLLQVSPDTWIAYYYSLGDTEVIDRAAQELGRQLETCQVLVTTESKGIPLTHAIATHLKLIPYVVCRKSVRPFMIHPLTVEYKPITAKVPERLYMDGRDAEKIRARRVAIVDDIISTGETMQAMEELVRKAGGVIAKKAAMLLEGMTYPNVIHLGVLPLFKRNSDVRSRQSRTQLGDRRMKR